MSVASHAASQAAGADGVVLSIGRADGHAAPGRVRLQVSYRAFASAYGGDFGARLALFAMPACALTTPRLRACRAMTQIPAVNDGTAGTLTATVTAPGAGAAPGVIAVSSTTSGGTGNYKATSLSPASTWNVGLATGDFTWSYPLRVPPPIAGTAPSLALAYNSGATDGETAQSNSQPGQIGEGFSLAGGGFIERKYSSCADHVGDASNNTGQTAKTGDLCYAGYNAYLNLGGQSTAIIRDASTGTWRLASDNGSTVKMLYGAANGAHSGIYWEVITTDGTRYYFGRNELPGWSTGKQTTNSVWTVPVVGLAKGDPCNTPKSTSDLNTYAKSVCDNMPWRWNLDLVVDPNGNATSYYYTPETNYYAFGSTSTGLGSTWLKYDSGGTLRQIYYGSVDNSSDSNNVYAHRPFLISLGYADRCTSTDQATCASNESGQYVTKYWPDVPWDLSCASSSGCSGQQHDAPAFFDTQMLTSVGTSVYEGSNPYQPVDTWNLVHQWLAGDSGNSDLTLYSITHTGNVGGTTTLPPVTFGYEPLGNKAFSDGYPQVVRQRLNTIVSETGAVTSVTYNAEPSGCTSAPASPPDLWQNTLPCFPQYWTPGDLGTQNPVLSWFMKYTVSKVTVRDTTGGNPDLVTSYVYCGTASPHCTSNSAQAGGAWHYDTSIDLVKAKDKSYGQWRGYQYVHVITGSPGSTQSETDYTFLRGMDGNPQTQSGGGFTYASVSVTPSDTAGTTQASAAVTDANALSGFGLEKITYDGPGGAQVSDQVTWPWTSTTATSPDQPWGQALTAVLSGTAETDTYAPLSAGAGGGTRHTQITRTFDPATGLPLTSDDHGDLSQPGQALCTTYSYPSPASAAGLIAYPDEIRTTACGTSGSPLVSDTQYSYDGQAFGTAPTSGNITRKQEWSSGDPGVTAHGDVVFRGTYDPLGRLLTSQDAAGNTTTYTYASSYGAGRPTTQETVTRPLTTSTTATTTTTLNPAWGVPASITDPSGQVTDYVYDPLGRVDCAWLPGQAGSTTACTGTPAYKFSYHPSAAQPSAVTTSRLIAAEGTYATTVQLYDSLLRPRQTQAPSDLGSTMMTVTDTLYGSRGNVVIQNGPYSAAAAPSTTLWTATAENQIPDETATSYDGAGRPTEAALISSGVQKWKTTWSYPGADAVTAVPPQGGTITTTYTDARGRITEIDQYHSATAASGAYDATTYKYAYIPGGSTTTITDAGGNTWKSTSDLLGRTVTATTPDTGTTTSTWNDLGQLTSTTSAAGKTVTWAYDAAGRKTAEYDTTGGAAPAPGNQLAAWTYDTATLDNPALPSGSKAIGQLASQTSYYGGTSGASLTETTGSYAPTYQPESVTYRVSSNAAGPLNGTSYTFGYTYNADGTMATQTYPAAGGLSAETVAYGYDPLGYPTATTGAGSSYASDYAVDALYDFDGQPTQIDVGTASSGVPWSRIGYTYDPATRRLGGTTIASQVNGTWPAISSTTYGYDPAGNITSAADSVTGDNQCYTYDYLARLTAAWAQASATCPATPPGASGLGGPAPYQQTLTYNTAGTASGSTSGTTGNITATTLITGSGTTAATTQTAYTYPAGGAAQPHAATSYTTTTGGTPATTTQTWTPDGQLATTTTGNATTSYNWNAGGAPPGQLYTLTTGTGTTVSYRYDASGNLLLRNDGGTITLYLPGEELTATGTTVTATRYYTLGGRTIAARTPTSLYWLFANPQGTDTTAINAATQAITRRYYTPYGTPRGTTPATWPGTRGYTGGTTDTTTGLTNLGAREYNPATPAFISPDPLLTPYQPTDLNPYSYAYNNPVTNTDPTGRSGIHLTGTGGSYCIPSALTSCAGIGGGQMGGLSDLAGGFLNQYYTTIRQLLIMGLAFNGNPNLASGLKQYNSLSAAIPARIPIGNPSHFLYAAGQAGGFLSTLPLGGGLGDGIDAASASTDIIDHLAVGGTAPEAGGATGANDGISLSLRYKAGWSPEQIAAADSKVANLNAAAQRGELVVSQAQRSGTSAASMFRSAGGDIPSGMDVDHMIDLQLGGANDLSNLSPLDLSVNRSLGAQIGAQLRGVPVGTCVIGVMIC
ncbi:MAG: RHS repeat protein [Streptosporangiaceae bacterium]